MLSRLLLGWPSEQPSEHHRTAHPGEEQREPSPLASFPLAGGSPASSWYTGFLSTSCLDSQKPQGRKRELRAKLVKPVQNQSSQRLEQDRDQ